VVVREKGEIVIEQESKGEEDQDHDRKRIIPERTLD
jgi:hypothetical protein